MKQKLTATLGCLIFCGALYAQGELPPVTFTFGTNVCDYTPWKLVLNDDFNGLVINPNRWYTFNSNNGGTNDDWSDGRIPYPGNQTVIKDENVVVSNGTLKLKIKQETTRWRCATCTMNTYQKNYTSGYISSNTTFNSGRIETRLKMPRFYGSWATCWTWKLTDVNEIDFAESYGGTTGYDFPYLGDMPRNTYSLHAWAPNPNPLGLVDKTISNKFPKQSWWNYLTGNHHHQEFWHTYICEWDPTSVKTYLDGTLVNTTWKYYKQLGPIKIGSGCTPMPGTWKILEGYPYNDESYSKLIFSTAMTISNKVSDQDHELGQMEIDYIKVYQRHPEQDNHAELCADNTYPPTPTISGPEEVCPLASFSLSPATSGNWSVNNSVLSISDASSSGVTLAKQAGSAFNYEQLTFSYWNGVAGCPTKSVIKYGLYCNESTDWMVVSPYVSNNVGVGRFHFVSELYYKRDVSDATAPVVFWNISINPGQDSYDERTAQNYTLYGQYASSPPFSVKESQSYNLRWTMNVTDASGTWSRSGERNSKTPLMQQGEDKNTFYVNAYIDDQDYYDATVYYGIASNMVSEEEFADSLYMAEMTEKVKADALEPYLITDGMEEMMGKNGGNFDKPGEESGVSAIKSKLKVYPNPIRSNITIIADARFIDKQPVTIHVYDLAGKLIKTGTVDYNKGNIMTYDLSGIADGIYIMELQQGHLNEHVKIIKAKN